MEQQLDQLRAELLGAVNATESLSKLDDVRVNALGKKGRITSLMKGLGKQPADQRRALGQAYNELKKVVAVAIEDRRRQLDEAALEAKLVEERVDITLPTRPEQEGRLHAILQTIEEITAILGEFGFQVAEGPDIEVDFNNFTALNIPAEHPARQDHDTFYLRPDENGVRKVLRTHTSPVQIRTMLSNKPPLRIIAPGRVYRCDYDATHSPMFHQVEGLIVDRDTHMGHLKGCLIEFCRAFFEVDDLPMRFRSSYFPFTEPSAEVDIGCSREGGALTIGGGSDWLEVLGCGMVHPNVLRNCGIDPTEFQGFAFGMGVERLAMLKYGIPDLRTFFEGDLRWLHHYGFNPLRSPSMVGGLHQ